MLMSIHFMNEGKTLMLLVCGVRLPLTSPRSISIFDMFPLSPLGPTPRCLHVVAS